MIAMSSKGDQQTAYRGRVRSGCLTCRSRKVKCDERRPVCNNCTRLKRTCVYKPRQSRQRLNEDQNPVVPLSASQSHRSGDDRKNEEETPTPPICWSLSNGLDTIITSDALTFSGGTTEQPWSPNQHPFLSPDNAKAKVTAQLGQTLQAQPTSATPRHNELGEDSPSALISRDIELTTTIDILAAGDISHQSSFSYFIDNLELPPITIYDCTNWADMKRYVVDLGASNSALSSAIIALTMLHKAVVYRLPFSKALSLYHSTKKAYTDIMEVESQEFEIILVTTFLLYLFEFIHYDTNPILRVPHDGFLKGLKIWSESSLNRSLLSSRLILWMRLLHIITIRGGGRTLIAESVINLFPAHGTAMTDLPPLTNNPMDTSTYLFQLLSVPIFDVYCQLQAISAEIAGLSHYHRSRITGTDQEEVVAGIAEIKSRLRSIWESRSTTQRQLPQDIRANLAPKIAEPIISLVGVCSAAYHAEFIEMGRVLGDPVTENIDSKQAMTHVRDLVEGEWNAFDGPKLSAGYLRPLFLYAIECIGRQDTDWAVEQLEKIKSPICRSDFFATFARELTEAQIRKERRVTSKYFCISCFGVPPPYL